MNRFTTMILMALVISLTACGDYAGAASKAQIFDALLVSQRAGGVTLAGGKAYFYTPGTETYKAIYADRNKTIPAANPYTLSADGTAMVYGDGLYDVKITNSAGVQKYLWEDVMLTDFTPGETSGILAQDTSGTYTSVANIDTANTDVSLAGQTIVVTVPLSLVSSITLATDRAWEFRKGAMITTTGYTFDANGASFNAGGYQIFTGSGTVKFPQGSTVPPEWFGAKGDYNASTGTGTESATAIQKAIDSLGGATGSTTTANEGGGGTVPLSGKYKCSSGLVLKYGVTLYNPSGAAERSNRAYKSAAGLYFFGTGYDAVTIGTAGTSTSAMQAGLKGISIFNSPRDGIVVNSFASVIDGVSVVHAMGSGIVYNSGGGANELFKTHVIGPAKHGIVIGTNDVRILDCEVQQPNSDDGRTIYNTLNPSTPIVSAQPLNTYDSFYITGSAFQIINCRFGDDLYRSRDGIRIVSGSGQITANDILNSTQAGINILSGNGFVITGNKIVSASTSASKCAMYLTSGIVGVTFTSNHINGITTGGLGGVILNGTLSQLIIQNNSYFGNWSGAFAVVVPVSADRETITASLIDNGTTPFAYTRAQSLTGATPTLVTPTYANSYVNLNNSGATSVTDFLGGYPGQRITILAVNANSTIVHNTSKIRLNGSANWNMPSGATLTLIKSDVNFLTGSVWWEVGRSTP